MKSIRRLAGLFLSTTLTIGTTQQSFAAPLKIKETLSLSNGVNIPLTWLIPSESIAGPRALVILQHGMMRNAEKMMALAQSLVSRNIEVVLPTMKDSQNLDEALPKLFAEAFELKQADPQGRAIPEKLILAGFSAGARFLSQVAPLINKSRTIRGVILLDPVTGNRPIQQMGVRIPVPYFTMFAKPSTCNANGVAFPLFASGRYETHGFRLKTASHCDFEGESSDALCYLSCGSSPQENKAVIQKFATEWISALIDSDSPSADYLPGGKVFQDLETKGMFDTIFK